MNRVVELERTHLKPDDLTFINDLEFTAKLSTLLKQPDEESLLEELLAVKIKSFGPNHERVAYTEITLAICYMVQKKFADAESLCKKSLETRLKNFKEPHILIAESYHNLGTALADQKKYEEALTNLERAWFNAQSLAGTNSVLEAKNTYLKAKSMHGLRKDGADAAARKSLELAIATFGEDDAGTIRARELLKAVEADEGPKP